LVVDATAEIFVVRLQEMGTDFDEKNQKEAWSNTIMLARIVTDRIQGCWSLTQQRKDLLLGYRRWEPTLMKKTKRKLGQIPLCWRALQRIDYRAVGR